MFISSMGTESLLGGGVGLVLVLGNVSSVLGRMFVDPGPISEENLASRVRNLLDTKSLILKISPFLSLSWPENQGILFFYIFPKHCK